MGIACGLNVYIDLPSDKPLQETMEDHHVSWENSLYINGIQWPFSIANSWSLPAGSWMVWIPGIISGGVLIPGQ